MYQTIAEFAKQRQGNYKGRKLGSKNKRVKTDSQREKEAYNSYNEANIRKIKATTQGFKKNPHLAAGALGSIIAGSASAGLGAYGATVGYLTRNKKLMRRSLGLGAAGYGLSLGGGYLAGRKARESVGYYGK